MNRIFKTVFSRTRGVMMVANELTKSHQVGKKAAVAVVVAGVLGSNAVAGLAANTTVTDFDYSTGQITVDGVVVPEDVFEENYDMFIYGGSNTSSEEHSYEMNIKGTSASEYDWKTIVGAAELSGLLAFDYPDKSATVNVGSSTVTISGQATSIGMGIFGGSFIQASRWFGIDSEEGAFDSPIEAISVNTKATNITFTDAAKMTFFSYWDPISVVSAGDVIIGADYTNPEYGSVRPSIEVRTNITDSTLTLTGGDYGDAILSGGSLVSTGGDGTIAINAYSNVEKSVINVTGNVSAAVIVGGGVAEDIIPNFIKYDGVSRLESSVKSSTINIGNSETDDTQVSTDVYAGGLHVLYRDSEPDVAAIGAIGKVSVQESTINVTNAKVTGTIYGTNAQGALDEDYRLVVKSTNEAVGTHLNLTNSTVNKVVLFKGSEISVAGENTVNNLTFENARIVGKTDSGTTNVLTVTNTPSLGDQVTFSGNLTYAGDIGTYEHIDVDGNLVIMGKSPTVVSGGTITVGKGSSLTLTSNDQTTLCGVIGSNASAWTQSEINGEGDIKIRPMGETTAGISYGSHTIIANSVDIRSETEPKQAYGLYSTLEKPEEKIITTEQDLSISAGGDAVYLSSVSLNSKTELTSKSGTVTLDGETALRALGGKIDVSGVNVILSNNQSKELRKGAIYAQKTGDIIVKAVESLTVNSLEGTSAVNIVDSAKVSLTAKNIAINGDIVSASTNYVDSSDGKLEVNATESVAVTGDVSHYVGEFALLGGNLTLTADNGFFGGDVLVSGGTLTVNSDVKISGGVLTLGQKDADPAVIGKLNLESFTQDGGKTTINAGSTFKVTGEMNVTGGEFSNAGIIDVTEAAKLAALDGVVLEQGGSLEAKSGQFFSTALDEEGKVEEAGKVDLLGLTAKGGALALIDAKYNLAYVQSANELLTGAKFDGKLVMRGTLVESETEVKDMTIDQIGSVGDNTVLSQVTGSTENKNLVIGSDSSDANTASTSNSIGVANLDLGAGSSVQVGGDKTLTLVGNGGELVNSTAASTTIELNNGNLEIGGTDNGTTGGTLKSDVTVGVNSKVTISGEADFNLSSNVTLTSSTSTASIQDNASVTISKTNIEAGTMDIKSQAKANVETMTLGNGAVLNVNEKANATVGKLEGAGTINVGNEKSAGKLTINDASKHTGLIFVDPAWSDDDSLNVIENASSLEIFTRDSTSIASKIIVGTNSIVALGGSAEEAVAAFNAIKDAQGGSWRDVGAALYVGSPITVDGGILVKEGASLDDANGMTAGKIALENHSMLIVNSEAGREGAAITGDVEFGDGSVLGLTNADAGEFTLASGDVVVGNDVTVKTDNPFISADLTEDGTITAEVAAENGLGALASTGIQAMARRADFVLAQTIADRTAVDQELGTGLNLWADVTGERYEADSLQNGGNFKADTGYGAFGADFALTQDVALGGAIQYGTGSVRSGVSNIKNEIDSYGITAYGSMKFGDAKLVGELAYIKSENDISSSQTALNGKVDADIYSLGVTAQYKLTAGNFSFVPSIGMRVSRLETDGMAIGAVTVDKQKQTLVQVPVALRVTAAEFDTNGWSVAPSFKIAYVPTFGDKEIKVLGAEQDVIDTSPVQGEFGVNARNGNLMLNANMILGGGKDGTSSVGGKIGVKYLF